MSVRISAALLITLAACGGDKPSVAVDAAVPIDAPPPAPTVLEVVCPSTVPLTVEAPDADLVYVFAPANQTIAVGQIVKFTMRSSHNVVPNVSMSDAGLAVGFNETKCLQFTKAGMFGFYCGPHFFTATITVL
jgi:plastocyanin